MATPVPATGQGGHDNPGTPASVPRWMPPLAVSLFFLWGFTTVLNDTLIPKLKGLFTLSYTEVMLTQFCFFLAYFIMSVPSGWVLSRLGYMRSIVAGLLVMAAGCLLFSPAARMGSYPGFLAALFITASGITLLQVAANPLIAIIGPRETSHSRLTLAQAFNSLGTTVGPYAGAYLILSGGVAAIDPGSLAPEALAAARAAEAASVENLFLMIAAVLGLLAVIFYLVRRKAGAPVPAAAPLSYRVLRHKRLGFGALSIFVYVGAEVTIGSFMINYLMQKSVLDMTALEAGKLVSWYWGGAMIGRFIGSAVLKKVNAGTVIMACALGAGGLAVTSALTLGAAAGFSLIAVGLFNSIMFPTIFAAAIEGLGDETPQGSGILCQAIVGGALVPLAAGWIADLYGLSAALILPALCYLWIAAYGRMAAKGLSNQETENLPQAMKA